MSDLRAAIEGLPVLHHNKPAAGWYPQAPPNDDWLDRAAVLALIPEGAVLVRHDPQDRYRYVRVDLLSTWGTRTNDGARLTAEWGKPDADGIYEPMFTRHDEGAVLVTEASLATLRTALAIGRISYEGDAWFAADAGYDYDDAEQTLAEAAAILAQLRAQP